MWAGGGIEFSRPDRLAAKHRQGGQRGKRTDHCPRQQSWVPVARTMKSVPIGGARCPDCRGNSGSLPAKRCGWPGRQPRPTPLTCRWQRRRTHQGDQDRRDRERIAGVLTATPVNTTMRRSPAMTGIFRLLMGAKPRRISKSAIPPPPMLPTTPSANGIAATMPVLGMDMCRCISR
jgi:hypothetical protein